MSVSVWTNEWLQSNLFPNKWRDLSANNKFCQLWRGEQEKNSEDDLDARVEEIQEFCPEQVQKFEI